jgi:hypothetical protein
VNYSPPHWLIWVLLFIAIGLAALLTIIDLKKLSRNNPIAWEVYDNLSVFFRNLMHTQDVNDRAKIYEQIETERGKLPDKHMDKIIDGDILNVEKERFRLNMSALSDDAETYLSEGLTRLRNYIFSKYGERIWRTKANVNTANPPE